MKYAKLIDQSLVYAPSVVQWRGRTVINPSGEKLVELGYKPVRYTDPPETDVGYEAVSGWEETATEIIQTWEIAEAELDAAEAMNILFGGGRDEA